jgi:hypothetical protein
MKSKRLRDVTPISPRPTRVVEALVLDFVPIKPRRTVAPSHVVVEMIEPLLARLKS